MKRAPCLKGYGVFCYIEKDILDRILCTEKNTKIIEKRLAIWKNFQYTYFCCDMIAMKCEVAALRQVFRGANVKLGN